MLPARGIASHYYTRELEANTPAELAFLVRFTSTEEASDIDGE
jgi:hypothetical protein